MVDSRNYTVRPNKSQELTVRLAPKLEFRLVPKLEFGNEVVGKLCFDKFSKHSLPSKGVTKLEFGHEIRCGALNEKSLQNH
jgi:hypothetical protein